MQKQKEKNASMFFFCANQGNADIVFLTSVWVYSAAATREKYPLGLYENPFELN